MVEAMPVHTTHRMLVIIPKIDKTIIGVYYQEKCILKATIPFEKGQQHAVSEAAIRQQQVLKKLNETGINLSRLNAVTSIGGLLRPVEGGTYKVNKEMLQDLINHYNGRHASNLGGIIAARIAADLHIPAYVIDPPVVDEMNDIARYSGYPGIERKSVFHALNQKAAARNAAKEINLTYDTSNMLVAHIGNGISVAAHQQGKVIDVNNGLHGDGPFSLERAGALPSSALIDLCYNQDSTKENIIRDITFQGGLKGYLNVKDISQIEDLLHNQDSSAIKIVEAMSYQISKEIGAMATVLTGNVDAIVLTGEFATLKPLTDFIISQISWIGDVLLFPGDAEMQALNAGTLRVLRNEESPKVYRELKEKGVNYDD